MFRGFIRKALRIVKLKPQQCLVAALAAYNIFRSTSFCLSEEPKLTQETQAPRILSPQIMKRELKEVQVCSSVDILEGDNKTVTVLDAKGEEREILLVRYEGKLLALGGTCTFKPPLDSQRASLKGAVRYRDKLYCPEHGCVYNVETGSVENGPAFHGLPKFFVSEREGCVFVTYPLVFPTSIGLSISGHSPEDNRKIIIIGGDPHATIGSLHGFRIFGYTGEISIIIDNQNLSEAYPYRKDLLHKAFYNIRKNKTAETEQSKNKAATDQKSVVKTDSTKEGLDLDSYLKDLYTRLDYYPKDWYEFIGVKFIPAMDGYRIINRRYSPRIRFVDRSQMPFDGLIVAAGDKEVVPEIEELTYESPEDAFLNLRENVFLPTHSKLEHQRMFRFLNNFSIKNLLVLGLTPESLQFVAVLRREFPDIKINIIDKQVKNSIYLQYGQQLSKAILRSYTKQGVQIYANLKSPLYATNQFSFAKTGQKTKTSKSNLPKHNPYQNSIEIGYRQKRKILKTDCVVLFPIEKVGNTTNLKKSKYTSYNFTSNKLIKAGNDMNTGDKRIYAAGAGCSSLHFLAPKQLVGSNPILAYEQGFVSALNLLALKVPFAYVPFEVRNYLGNKVIYAGCHNLYDETHMDGSYEKGDFLTYYFYSKKLIGVAASPSRIRDLQVLREGLRVEIRPTFKQVESRMLKIDMIDMIIKKAKLSGCYKELLLQTSEHIYPKDVIFMERDDQKGVNTMGLEEESDQEIGWTGEIQQL